VDAVNALRTGILDGRRVRSKLNVLNGEVFHQGRRGSWSRLAQRELQVRSVWMASVLASGPALRDGSVDAEGGVYRKIKDDAGIRFLKAEHIAIPDLGVTRCLSCLII